MDHRLTEESKDTRKEAESKKRGELTAFDQIDGGETDKELEDQHILSQVTTRSAAKRLSKGMAIEIVNDGTVEKKRVEKAVSKQLPCTDIQASKYYHCCLADKRSDGECCPGTRFHTSEIWRHVRREMHLGRAYQKERGLPKDVARCNGHGCQICLIEQGGVEGK